MATNFPANPSNGDTHAGFTFNSATGAWESSAVTPSSQDPAVTVYATVDDLPTSGVTTGQQAFVSATNRLYIWNSSGWYNIALINTTPSISGASASYDLASDGTPTVVTITASDPEGLPITYDIVSDTSGNTATVTSNNNIFTITPSTNDADAGTFSLTFRASDGVNIASAISEFTLAFQIQNSNYTTALITSVGTNNQVNNDFVDSSTNSHTITAAGNATQTTFSPYRHGGYSTYFDGTGDYITAPSHTSFDFGTGDFTIETWINIPDVTSTWLAFISRAYAQNGGWRLYKNTGNNNLRFYYTDSGTSYIEATTTGITNNTWHHITVVRNSSTTKIYVDGVEKGSGTISTSLNPGSYAIEIGSGVVESSFPITGYMTDVRIVKGTAVYTSAFTPPTEHLTAITNTSLLACHLPYIADGSTNSHAITINGNTHTRPFSPYDYTTYSAGTNGGSMYFSDGNAYLTASPTAPGTGDFCYECWINVPQASDDAILETRTATSSPYGFTLTVLDPSTIRVYSNNAKITASGLSYLNQWTHLCVEKVGSTTTLYINGTSFGTTTDLSNMSDTTFHIGESQQYGAFSGHIADFRYVRGGYVYNGNFTPPTAPLTAISGTELLINGTNAGIIDKSQSVKTLTLAGDTKSSTTQTKYLSSSMYFDGTGDYITMTPSNLFTFGTEDFTIEGWAYPTATGDKGIFQQGTSNFPTSSANSLAVQTTTSGTKWAIYAGNTQHIAATATYSLNQWYHFAVVRASSTTKLYIDGVEVISISDTTNYTGTYMGIGSIYGAANAQCFVGYIEDFRVTKGLARYTANFTPPTAALKG